MGSYNTSCISPQLTQSSFEYTSCSNQIKSVEYVKRSIDLRSTFSFCKENNLQGFVWPIQIEGEEGEKCEYQAIINKYCKDIESISKLDAQNNNCIKQKVRMEFYHGIYYEGEILGNYMHGYGRLQLDELIYEGTLSFNSMHGFGWLRINEENELLYEYIGEFNHNIKQGNGTQRWRNGKKYIGQWQNGQMAGKGAMYNANSLDYVIYENGQPRRDQQ